MLILFWGITVTVSMHLSEAKDDQIHRIMRIYKLTEKQAWDKAEDRQGTKIVMRHIREESGEHRIPSDA